MKEYIESAVAELKSDKEKIEEQIRLLENFDITKPVDAYMWRQLCRTPLRGTKPLEDIAAKIFPDAENIMQTANNVVFQLYGFIIKLPTYEGEIEVDMKWYKPDLKKPVNYAENHRMKRYFKLKDAGADWEELFDIRLKEYKKLSRRKKAVLWFLKYRWKSDNRKEWEKEFKTLEERYLKSMDAYHTQLHDMYCKTKIFKGVLMPALLKFSSSVRPEEKIKQLYENPKEECQ